MILIYLLFFIIGLIIGCALSFIYKWYNETKVKKITSINTTSWPCCYYHIGQHCKVTNGICNDRQCIITQSTDKVANSPKSTFNGWFKDYLLISYTYIIHCRTRENVLNKFNIDIIYFKSITKKHITNLYRKSNELDKLIKILTKEGT